MRRYIYILFFIFFFTLFNCKSTDIGLQKEIKTIKKETDQRVLKANQFLIRGNREFQLGNYQKAIEYANQSLELYITFDAYYLIGMSYYQLNDFNSGLSALLSAEKINPAHEQLLLTLSLIYTSLNQYEEAILRLKKLLEIKPEDSYYLYRMGLTYKEMQKYDVAISYLEKANKEDFPYRYNVLLLLGDIYFNLKDYEKSQQYYRELEILKPDSKEVQTGKKQNKIAVLLEEASNAFRNKQYKQAEDIYRQVIQLQPNQPIGYLQLGIVYSEEKEYDKAIENFKKALELDKNLDNYLFLCKVYLDNLEWDMAKSCLEKANSLYPENEKILNLMALYYKNLGDNRKSISILKSIINKNENSLSAHKNLYLIYLEEGNIENAEIHLNKILVLVKYQNKELELWNLEKNRLQSLKLIKEGDKNLKLHKYSISKNLYYRALSLHKNPEVYIALGNFFYKQKNFNESEKNYFNALKISNNSIHVYKKIFEFYKNTNQINKYNKIKNEVIIQSKNNLQMLVLYTKLLIEEKNLKEALEINQRIYKQNKHPLVKKNLGEVYYYLALEANKNKNFQLANQYIKEALVYDSENILYKNAQEIIKENLQYKDLIALLEKAEELYFKEEYNKAKSIYLDIYKKWKKPLILVRLAEIEFYTGNEVGGYNLINQALKEKPKEISVLEALYTRLLEINRLKEAKEGFKSIIALKEDSYFSYYKLGVIELIEKNYKEALNYFEDAILYNQDFLPSRIGKALSYYFLKDLEKSREEFLEISKQQGSGKEIAILNLAILHLNQNQNVKAKEELKKLIMLFPEYADAYYHLAYIEYEDKNFLESERLLKKALEIQKKDLYYWGLIKLYQGLDLKKQELISICKYFLSNYPSSIYYENVKSIYLKLTEQKQFFEVSFRVSLKEYQILSVENQFIFYNNTEIISIQKNSEKINYHLKFNSILQVFIDKFLWIVLDNQIKAFDIKNGREIISKTIPPVFKKICTVYQALPEWILEVSPSSCQENKFLLWKDQFIEFNNLVLKIYNTKILYLQKDKLYIEDYNTFFNSKENNKKSQLLDLQNKVIEEIQNYNSNCLLITNDYVYLIDLKNQIIKFQKEKLPNSKYILTENYLVEIQLEKDNSILNFWNILENQPQLIVKDYSINNIIDLNSKFYTQENKIFFLDANQSLHYLDLEDTNIQLRTYKELNNYKNGIITFYY